MIDLQLKHSSTDLRLIKLKQFIDSFLSQKQLSEQYELEPIVGDASFRRYFRIHFSDFNLIAMDAPPDKENAHVFFEIANLFKEKGLAVPNIEAFDFTEGFLLMTDFGDDLYFHLLEPNNADFLYQKAIDELLILQKISQNAPYCFPNFTPLLKEELIQFKKWFLETHLQIKLSTQDNHLLQEVFSSLIDSAVNQPQVCVHRDYHSRNLMLLPQQRVGLLDFQDAVWGPVTYDLVSLIRDCYINWPLESVHQWIRYYYEKAVQLGYLKEEEVEIETFSRWVDWMGIQRHLKALYIFARKKHRDNNSNYLKDIPRTLQYVLDVTAQYPVFKEFNDFLRFSLTKSV